MKINLDLPSVSTCLPGQPFWVQLSTNHSQLTPVNNNLLLVLCANETAGEIQTEKQGEGNRRRKEIIQTSTWTSFPLLYNPLFFTPSLPLPSPTCIASLWPSKEKEVLKFHAQLRAKTPDSGECHHLQSSAAFVSYSHCSPLSFLLTFPLSVLETQNASKSSKIFEAYLDHSDKIIHRSHFWLYSSH